MESTMQLSSTVWISIERFFWYGGERVRIIFSVATSCQGKKKKKKNSGNAGWQQWKRKCEVWMLSRILSPVIYRSIFYFDVFRSAFFTLCRAKLRDYFSVFLDSVLPRNRKMSWKLFGQEISVFFTSPLFLLSFSFFLLLLFFSRRII